MANGHPYCPRALFVQRPRQRKRTIGANMKKSKRSTQSYQPDLAAPDLIRLGPDGMVKVAELYAKVADHWRRQLRGADWQPVVQLIASIPVRLCNAYLRLGLPVQELEGVEKVWVTQASIANYFHSRFLEAGEYETKKVGDKEYIRLRPIAGDASMPQRRNNSGRRRTTAPDQDVAPSIAPRLLKNCPQCGVAVGEFHDPSRAPEAFWCCNIEQCPYCGGRAYQCRCPDIQKFGGIPADDRMRFDGHYPEEPTACTLGWFFRWGRNDQIIRCGPDHRDASPDICRVSAEANWDRYDKRFVLPVSSSKN